MMSYDIREALLVVYEGTALYAYHTSSKHTLESVPAFGSNIRGCVSVEQAFIEILSIVKLFLL